MLTVYPPLILVVARSHTTLNARTTCADAYADSRRTTPLEEAQAALDRGGPPVPAASGGNAKRTVASGDGSVGEACAPAMGGGEDAMPTLDFDNCAHPPSPFKNSMPVIKPLWSIWPDILRCCCCPAVRPRIPAPNASRSWSLRFGDSHNTPSRCSACCSSDIAAKSSGGQRRVAFDL